jgi:hypothetical protein
MKCAVEVDITKDDKEYAIVNDRDNEPLAEGNNNGDNEYASAARCAESIILSASPTETMKLSALADSIMLSALPTESMIL